MRLAATVLVVGLLGNVGCSNEGPQTTSAASVTSADLKQMVQSKMASDTQLAQVEVNADAGRNQVTLSGSAASEQARHEAVELAQAARPGLTVVDQIQVKPQVVSRSEYTEDMARDAQQKAKDLGDKIGASLDDAWIYSKIKAQLATEPSTPATQIHVDVSKGIVTLRGAVDSATVKQTAERIATGTEGVRRVRDLLKVRA